MSDRMKGSFCECGNQKDKDEEMCLECAHIRLSPSKIVGRDHKLGKRRKRGDALTIKKSTKDYWY